MSTFLEQYQQQQQMQQQRQQQQHDQQYQQQQQTLQNQQQQTSFVQNFTNNKGTQSIDICRIFFSEKTYCPSCLTKMFWVTI